MVTRMFRTIIKRTKEKTSGKRKLPIRDELEAVTAEEEKFEGSQATVTAYATPTEVPEFLNRT